MTLLALLCHCGPLSRLFGREPAHGVCDLERCKALTLVVRPAGQHAPAGHVLLSGRVSHSGRTACSGTRPSPASRYLLALTCMQLPDKLPEAERALDPQRDGKDVR